VWAAGHSVSGADRVLPVAELVELLDRELREARSHLFETALIQSETD